MALELNKRDWCSLQKVMDSMKRMESFCRTKKNLFLPIREGITVALRETQIVKEIMKSNDYYIDHFEYHLRDKMVQKIKEVRSPKKVVLDEGTQTLPEPAPRSALDPCKRLREPTVSPEVMATKKPVEKRPRNSKHPEEWVEVPVKKDPCKKKTMAASRKVNWRVWIGPPPRPYGRGGDFERRSHRGDRGDSRSNQGLLTRGDTTRCESVFDEETLQSY